MFTLAPIEKVPERIRPKNDEYHKVLEDFLESGYNAAEITATNKKPVTIVAGLQKIVGGTLAKVATRKDEYRDLHVYLVRQQ